MRRVPLVLAAIAFVVACRRKPTPAREVRPDEAPSTSASSSSAIAAPSTSTSADAGATTQVASDVGKPPRLIASVGSLYWASDRAPPFIDKKLFTVAKAGGSARVVATAPKGTFVTVGDFVFGAVYWSTSGDVFETILPGDPDPPMTEIWSSAGGTSTPRLVMEAGGLWPVRFYASGSRVCASTITRLNPTQHVSAASCFDPADPTKGDVDVRNCGTDACLFQAWPPLVVGGDRLFGVRFDDGIDPTRQLVAARYKPTAETFEEPVDLKRSPAVKDVLLDRATLFYTDGAALHALDVRLASPTVKTLASVAAGPEFDLIADEKHVYFRGAPAREIQRVPRGGGAVEIVYTGKTRIDAFTIDVTDVYWVEGGVLWKRKKDP